MKCKKHGKYNGAGNITTRGTCVNCRREANAKKNDPLFENLQRCQSCGNMGHEGKGSIVLCKDKANNEEFLCCECAGGKSERQLPPVSGGKLESLVRRGRVRMGDGINAARDMSPEHTAMIDNLKDQLLIVFLKRLGGKASIPVIEIDDTGQDLFSFRIDNNQVFHFEASKKS